MTDRSSIAIRISSAEIAARIEELAHDIQAAMAEDTLMVPILTGSFVFAADLVRALARAGADWPLQLLVTAALTIVACCSMLSDGGADDDTDSDVDNTDNAAD